MIHRHRCDKMRAGQTKVRSSALNLLGKTRYDHGFQAMRYRVIRSHTSEFPDPISFQKGAYLSVGQKYEGPEEWNDWYFCETPGQKGGWVPVQVIQMTDAHSGIAIEDYTAREIEANEGDHVEGSRQLNGWLWCNRVGEPASGWFPLDKLEPVDC